MAQGDYIVDNGTGAVVRTDINTQLQAVLTVNSGTTEPASKTAYMLWTDTTANVLKQRNAANNAWITLFELAGLGAVQSSDLVLTSTDQDIAGVKNYISSPIVPTPTAGDSSTKPSTTAFVGTAITNALASPTLTASATTNVTTNNIAMTGIGIIGTLEVGDVIQMSGFANASNNSEFTVEVITDDDNVIVNQAHAGGTTSKSLITETATATIILLTKWYNASDTLGRDWVDLTSTNSSGVTYTNPTPRAFVIRVVNGNGSLSYGKVDITMNSKVYPSKFMTGNTNGNYGITENFTVKEGTYSLSFYSLVFFWAELR